jgi:hypothetical protein
MNRAPVIVQKWALLVAGLAKPHLAPGAIDVLRLERFHGRADKLGSALQVGLGQIDKAVLVAAIHTSALAGKANGIQAVWYRVRSDYAAALYDPDQQDGDGHNQQ